MEVVEPFLQVFCTLVSLPKSPFTKWERKAVAVPLSVALYDSEGKDRRGVTNPDHQVEKQSGASVGGIV